MAMDYDVAKGDRITLRWVGDRVIPKKFDGQWAEATGFRSREGWIELQLTLTDAHGDTSNRYLRVDPSRHIAHHDRCGKRAQEPQPLYEVKNMGGVCGIWHRDRRRWLAGTHRDPRWVVNSWEGVHMAPGEAYQTAKYLFLHPACDGTDCFNAEE